MVGSFTTGLNIYTHTFFPLWPKQVTVQNHTADVLSQCSSSVLKSLVKYTLISVHSHIILSIDWDSDLPFENQF